MRRILAMLMAIVMLLGTVPVQAFATEAEPLETTVCITEGCTYGADHDGVCSTFVACTTEGCSFASGHEGNCSNYAAPEVPETEPEAPAVEPAADAVVSVTVSDRGELVMAYEEITVSDTNADGKLSVDEALYAAHTASGKGYSSQEGTVTQLWGVETTNVSFFVNHGVISADVAAETISAGDYLVASVDQDAVNDYDKYSCFQVTEASARAGEAFNLILTDDAGNALAGMEIGLSDGKGSTTMTGLTTDVDGSVVLTLDQEGMYCVTARGTVVETSIDVNTMEISSIEIPIIAPVCVVTVSGNAEEETVTVKSNVAGYTASANHRAAMSNQSSHSVTVGFTVVDCLNHQVERMRRELTVTPGLAKAYFPEGQYGGSTQLATVVGENDVTPVDVLVAAHLDAYGDAFAANPGEYIEGFDYATKMFGAQSEITWTANGIMPYLPAADEANTAGYDLGYAINQYIVKDHDEICFYRMSYNDYPGSVYASFENIGEEIPAGERLTLRLGYCSTMEYHEGTFPAANAEIYFLNEDGTLGDSAGVFTDENGEAEVTLSETDTCYLTCVGEVEYESWGMPTPGKLSPAYVKITVTAPACQHTGTETKYTSIQGETKHTAAVTCTDCGEQTQESVTEDCRDENGDNTCDLCEAPLPVAVESITLNKTTLEMTVGDEPVTLTAAVFPENATYEKISWTSNPTSVVTVVDGVVTAVAAGTATIIAKAGDVTAECAVTVKAAPAEAGGITIATGDTFEYIATDHFLSEIVLAGLQGTVTGDNPEWDIQLPADTEINQPLTIQMTSAYTIPQPKSNRYFWVNEIHSEKKIAEEEPGSVTITPVWENGQTTITVGVGQNKTFDGKKYTITLTVAGQNQNNAPELTDKTNNETKAEIIAGESYSLNLESLFTDKDEDELTYTVQINDAAPVAAAAAYGFQPAEPGDYTLVFHANDGEKDSEDCYIVHLTVLKNSEPYLLVEPELYDTAKQYYPWSIDLTKVFADDESKELTYTVLVNEGTAVPADAAYTYTPDTPKEHILVFQAKDPSGAESEEFMVFLDVEAVRRTDIASTCTGTTNGETWLDSIAVLGVAVNNHQWNVSAGHGENQPHHLRIELEKDTPDHAVIDLRYTLENYGLNEGTYDGPESVTLQNGKGVATVTVSNWLNNGTPKTYLLHFSNEPNEAPAVSAATAEVTPGIGEEFSIDLNKIFTDEDELRYTVTINGRETDLEDGTFCQTIDSREQRVFLFTAYDVWGQSATHTVTVTPKVSVNTYAVTLLIPEEITPSFYITGSVNGEAGDTLGDALTAEPGEASGGFVPYEVAVPEDIFRISFRGMDSTGTNWGGMSVAVEPEMDPVTVIQLNAVVPSKVSGAYVTADQALFRLADQNGIYAVSGGAGTTEKGILCYRFLITAWGTEDLSKAYTTYVEPQGDLTSDYVDSVGVNKTFETNAPQQETVLRLTLKSSFTITAPAGAKVQLFQQRNYYNSPEIPVVETRDNENGTVDWIFTMGSSAYMSYRVSMEGKITKAGYVDSQHITITWDETDEQPNHRGTYDPATLYGSRGDDSLVLNVNGRNHLVMHSGDTFRLRGYRIWEIINSDTSNVVIHPDMHYTLSGDNIVSVTPVNTGNGNGKNNWLDLTATGSGVAYLEVGYDALNIVTGNVSGIDGSDVDGFTFNASDPARTGLVVIQVGNAAADVDFGIQSTGTWDGKAVAWDAEFDTLYFTGENGALVLRPSVESGAIASVAVSGNKGADWTNLAQSNGEYVAPIVSGNNVICVTKTDGTKAYQVVRGDRISVSITQQSGDGDDLVEAGETFRIQLHGLHNPIGKMSGNYNPGYQYGQHVNYSFHGSEVRTSKVYQYNFVSNAWVDVTIPANAQAGTQLTAENGCIDFNVFGIYDITSSVENHRGIGDDGCGTRGAAPIVHRRSILPDVTLTVGYHPDGSAPVDPVTELTLEPDTLTMLEGDEAALKATVKPADTEIAFSSDNNAVVQVSKDGVVKALKAGTAIVTVTAGDQTATCAVTVNSLDFGISEEDADGYVTISFEDQGQREESELSEMDPEFRQPLGTIVKATRVPFAEYDSIATVTLRLLKALGMTHTKQGTEDSGFYLSSIGNFTVGETTYTSFGEFDAGAGSGWMVTQNDTFIGKGASEFTVKNGDVIKWQYTCQLGADIGDDRAREEVDAVEKRINDIATPITLDSEPAIQAARKAYGELSPLQQGQVENYETLVAAEAELAALKADEADKQAAQKVVNLIEAIDEKITSDSKETIETARAEYEKLTDAQKALVTNYDELTAAEETLKLLSRVDADIANIYMTTGNYLAAQTIGTGSTGGEWAALGLARSGREVSDSYYEAAAAYVKETISNGRLHKHKSTENSRLILALTAIGKDVTDVDGNNLLTGLNDLTYIGKQGVNGLIYALIALDSHDYAPVGVTRDDLISEILSRQLGDGGWSLDADAVVSEVDMTAMAIQALAPYCGDTEVQAAVDVALAWLSKVQNRDGSFGSEDGPNTESIAQVIVALTALGIDPDADERFIKTDITPVQALAQFYVEGGGFEHTANTGRDTMATEQGYYALVAYTRFKNGQTSLYDMSDVKLDKEAAAEVDALINAIGTVTIDSGAKIADARDAYEALTENQKALVTKLPALVAAEEAFAQKQEDYAKNKEKAEAVEALIDLIGTVTFSDESEKKIRDARTAYNALDSLTQKPLVGDDYLAKLEAAEAAFAQKKQEKADVDAVNNVIARINKIPTNRNINLGDETVIQAALNAYNGLRNDALRNRVSNHETLLRAVDALNRLKSTVSVTFTLLGCYKHGNTETAVHTLAGKNLQTWIGAKTYKVKPGATVKDLFEQALTAAGLTWKNPTENYVESITRGKETLDEFTNGTYSGWMYTLNGKHPGLGVNQQKLSNGDEVIFHYTDDFRQEEGNNSKSGTTGSNSTGGSTTNIFNTSANTAGTELAETVERLIEDIGEEITLESEASILAARAAYDELTDAQKKLVENYDLLVAAEAALAELKGTSAENIYLETGDYIQGLGTPGVGNVGGEWMVIGLARSGRPVPSGYYDHVVNYVRENINDQEQLHSVKSSDNSRLILALTAIGKDVANVEGHNLLQGLSDMDYIRKQGINGPIWALLAFDSGNYPVPEGNVSREALIDVILEAQLSDGGWALSGERSDPDMTGMAIQALAPYMESRLDVKKALEAAIWALSKLQNDNGSFSSVDGPNSESIAQVIVALAALGIDADTDARFVKNGISALDALLTYYIPGGGFRHVLDGDLDGMSTEQAYYALVAYNRMLQAQNFLYDMTDVVDAGGDVIVEEIIEPTEAPGEPAEEEADNGNAVVIWTGVMTVCAAAIALLLLNRKKLFGKFL